MTIIRAMAIWPMDSAIPADSVVNTWHFQTPDASATSTLAINGALTTFYNTIRDLYSPDINHTGGIVKYYDLADEMPRPPRNELALSITAPGGFTQYPSELAICLSFQGDKVAGVPQARRRGRVYIGPLNSSTATGGRLIAPAAITTLVGAADALLASSLTDSNYTWIVHSSTYVSSEATVVTNGWVDNAFDIQRRRGLKATTRTTFT